MKIWFSEEAIDYELMPLDERDMKGIMKDWVHNPERSDVIGHPLYWAIVDNELVVWPFPPIGSMFKLMFERGNAKEEKA